MLNTHSEGGVFFINCEEYNNSKQAWCCDTWKAYCNQRYWLCLFSQGLRKNRKGIHFSIANVWKHSKHVLYSVWLKIGVLKLKLKTISQPFESLLPPNTCLLVRIAIHPDLLLLSQCDRLISLCLNIRKLKLMCKISGFVWEIISAKYMYLSWNYCNMLGTVYPIYFRFVIQTEPRIGRDDFMVFCPFVYCVWSQVLCVFVLVSEIGWKYV